MNNDTVFKGMAALSFIGLFIMVFTLNYVTRQLAAKIEAQVTIDEGLLEKIEALDAKYHERTIELKAVLAGRLPPRGGKFEERRKR